MWKELLLCGRRLASLHSLTETVGQSLCVKFCCVAKETMGLWALL